MGDPTLTRKTVVLVAALGLLLSSVGVALAQPPRKGGAAIERQRDNGVVDSAAETGLPPDDGQHDEPGGHLPGKKNNVRLISRLKLTDTDGGIADVHYYKGYAYLAAWAPECPNGGVHVVDVRNPRHPVKVGFLPAGPHDYVGEGVHAIHVENEFFTGDILLVNHEACDLEGTEGISLWDITNPTSPVPLAQHVGDYDVFGPPFANSVHSVMGFTQDGGSRAYAVLVDNYEAGSTDVDIMDITNPVAPVLITETGLPDWPAAEVDANGDEAFHHDMWFKRINGHDILAVSYWDAGWVFLNVDDPANPVFIYDTNYPDNDLLGFTPPEGNAHQGEWDQNAEFFLGTDEDFGPFRSKFEILTGPNAGEYPGAEFGWTVPIAENFENDTAEGTVVYGGSGCVEDVNNNSTSDRDEVPDAADYDAQYAAGEERIIVMTRGVCFFSDKIRSAELHGWDMAIIGNHHAGSGSGSFPDAYLCGSNGTPGYQPTISGGCTGHRAMHLVFGDNPEYGAEPHIGADLPAIGTVGEDVRFTSQFDGWGYLNLYDFETGEFLDYYSPPEPLQRQHAFGSGTLSIHEIETDRRRGVDLGYISWYAVGLKIVSWTENGIASEGVYRHDNGNDFWGVSLEKRGDKRPLIYMSDRDDGLWIFKFTGCTEQDRCRSKSPSSVSINYRHEFWGSVHNEDKACTRNRMVNLYKLNSATGERKLVGRDRTGFTGNWRIVRDNPNGRYTAEVKSTTVTRETTETTCGSDRSPIIKVNPTDDE